MAQKTIHPNASLQEVSFTRDALTNLITLVILCLTRLGFLMMLWCAFRFVEIIVNKDGF